MYISRKGFTNFIIARFLVFNKVVATIDQVVTFCALKHETMCRNSLLDLNVFCFFLANSILLFAQAISDYIAPIWSQHC